MYQYQVGGGGIHCLDLILQKDGFWCHQRVAVIPRSQILEKKMHEASGSEYNFTRRLGDPPTLYGHTSGWMHQSILILSKVRLSDCCWMSHNSGQITEDNLRHHCIITMAAFLGIYFVQNSILFTKPSSSSFVKNTSLGQ